MAWLARSIANTLNLDSSDDDDKESESGAKSNPQNDAGPSKSPPSSSSPRGVKEDLSEISKTISRQFWGVASFLAPPPEQNRSESSDADPITGIRGDFAEIGGKFRSGISKLSNNINVSEITKMASSLLKLEAEDEDETGGGSVEVVGVTEEALGFVRDIALHSETWLDFPILDIDGDDDDDFDLSDAQQEHALAVERLVPSLTDLRIELCPEYISESWFWKIYFVLLHPRLDKEDAAILSTPQIMEARALLANELKNRRNKLDEDSSGQKSPDSDDNPYRPKEEPLSVPSPVSQAEIKQESDKEIPVILLPTTSETVIQSLDSKEIPIEDKGVIEEEKNAATPQVKEQYFKPGSSNFSNDKGDDDDDDDADAWLKEEETSEIGGGNNVRSTIPIVNDEDVSFSDLEEEDEDANTNYQKTNYSSDKDSRDWVQLGKNSSSDSSSKDMNTHDAQRRSSHNFRKEQST